MAESKGEVRKRLGTVGSRSDDKEKGETTKSTTSVGDNTKLGDTSKSKTTENEATIRCRMRPGTYWLTRIVFTRSIGFVYCKLYCRARARNPNDEFAWVCRIYFRKNELLITWLKNNTSSRLCKQSILYYTDFCSWLYYTDFCSWLYKQICQSAEIMWSYH